MKFGQEYQKVLASEDFPEHWRDSAIEYKHLKKCIKKIHRELKAIGLDGETLNHLSEWIEEPTPEDGTHSTKEYFSAANPTLATVPEEFTPLLHVLVASKTGTPLDATLAPETKASLQKLARHEIVTAGRREHLGVPTEESIEEQRRESTISAISDMTDVETPRTQSLANTDARWVQVPLASAKDFFDLLEPKLQELEALRTAETEKLEEEILDLGDAVEDVVEPVRPGFEATRMVSYRDLYFWREMFRLYMERPIFYSAAEARQGALTFNEAKKRLEEYDERLRSSGLLGKMKTPEARKAAQQFLDLNVDILKIMHFQEMNARAMTKILKKFDKQTHLEGQMFMKNLRLKYPALITDGKNGTTGRNSAGGFANSIARDLYAEIGSKVLAIVPQLEDWTCPVCHAMAWRPVNLGCCRSVFCIPCVIWLQNQGVKRCPVCDKETVMKANGRNIDFETMDFLEKYFPRETKLRTEENEAATLMTEQSGEEREKSGCIIM